MNMNNTNMSHSEKLNMLLDGETSGIEPSEVFYELSHNPELQQEFLDIMKMKQLMSGVTEAPPEHLRRGVLAGIGLGGSGLWYYLQNSGVMVATSSFVSSKLGAALIACMFGAFSTFLIINNANKSESNNPEKTSIETNHSPITLSMNVPITTSFESGKSISKSTIFNKNNNHSLATNKYSDNTSENLVSRNSNYSITASIPVINAVDEDNIKTNSSQNLDYSEHFIASLPPNQRSGFIVNPTNRIVNDNDFDRQMLFSLQGKGITNNSLQLPEISTTEAPAINDIGIALMYLVSDNLEVGLEFGQEFLVKRVKAGNFSTEESMLENQLTFWGGMKVNYIFNDMEILPNLRPTTSLLLGGTSQGWVTKASVGLVYDFSNKLAVFGGPEWTTGIYQFESKLLSTHKWGFNYGIALRF